jgi:zinc protease
VTFGLRPRQLLVEVEQVTAPPNIRLETDPEVHLTSTDNGVPVLWSTYPGLLRARLLFRVGQADESLPIRGVTHVAEHLALSTLGQPTFEFNGSVENLVTSFDVAGEPEEVVGFLGHVCHALTALPMHRLETEKHILRIEESGAASPFDGLRRRRFGVHGFGLGSCAQLGLHRLDPPTVAHWAQQAFNAGNAVLWMSGPPPAHLRLPLPPGPRRLAPEAVSRSLPGPSWYSGNGPQLVMNAIGSQRPGLVAATWWLRRLLHWRLRMVEGQAYTPQAELIRLSHGLAELVVLLEGRPGEGARLLSGFLETLDQACLSSIPDQELEAWQRSVRYALAEPSAAFGLLERSARAVLLGEPVLDAVGVRAEADGVTAAAVRAELRATLATSLLQAPADCPVLGASWTPLPPAWVPPLRTGTTFVPARHRPQGARLVVGGEGVTWQAADGETCTIHWRSAAAALRWPDGRRVLIGNSGTSLTIEPDHWADSGRLSVEIDFATPDAVIVPMPEEESAPRSRFLSGLAAVSTGPLIAIAVAIAAVLLLLAGISGTPGINAAAVWVFSGVLALGEVFLVRAIVQRMRAPKDVRNPKKRPRSKTSVRIDSTIGRASDESLLPLMISCWVLAAAVILVPLITAGVAWLWPGIALAVVATRLTAERSRRRVRSAQRRSQRRF